MTIFARETGIMKYWTSIYSGVLIAITILVGQDGVEAKTKIIFMPPPTVSSPYFNMLAIAEEMQRRGNEVGLFYIFSAEIRQFEPNTRLS